MRRTILVVQSDPHAGHKLGLMLPGVSWLEKDETGSYQQYTPKPTAFQEWLTSIHDRTLELAKNMSKGDEIVLIINGDITHGNKYPEQLVSTSIANQILIAINNMQPWLALDNLSTFRITVGTAAHNFKENTAEILVADSLAREHRDKNIRVLHHGLANIGGALIDYAHHGPHPGSRYWLSGNIARLYARSIIMSEIASGKTPPALIVRGHYHTFIHEIVSSYLGDVIRNTAMVIMPSMCGLSDHAQQASQSSSRVMCGMMIFEIIDGKIVDTVPVIETVDNRTYEDL